MNQTTQTNNEIILLFFILFFIFLNISMISKYETTFGIKTTRPLKRIIYSVCFLLTIFCGYLLFNILN